jgi:transcriptional regulator with XRE-family HTH domain
VAEIDNPDQVGGRLRTAREQSGVSLRQLARQLNISASALSQIETGKSRPSVKTLYSIVSELGLSLDHLFADADVERSMRSATPAGPVADGAAVPSSIVQRGDSRASIELDSGVTWERLTPSTDAEVDFLLAVYEPGGSSSTNDKMVRHNGREYGIVLTGELELKVGFDVEVLRPGDSACFDSQLPHRLANRGEERATAIWFVIGRRQSDQRTVTFGNRPVDGA